MDPIVRSRLDAQEKTMINLEIVWMVASLITGAAVFYFANTNDIAMKYKTWASLFAGFLFSMGVISGLFMVGMLCNECHQYCESCKIVKPSKKHDTMNESRYD